MVNTLQRLTLAFLLILLLIGIAGHLVAPASGSHHFLSETNCAFHHGMNVPVSVQPSWSESGNAPEPAQDDTCTLDIVLNIPHPPTF